MPITSFEDFVKKKRAAEASPDKSPVDPMYVDPAVSRKEMMGRRYDDASFFQSQRGNMENPYPAIVSLVDQAIQLLGPPYTKARREVMAIIDQQGPGKLARMGKMSPDQLAKKIEEWRSRGWLPSTDR